MKYIFLFILVVLSGCNYKKISSDRDVQKGIKFMKSGQYLESGVQFKSAIKENPDNYEAHFYYGVLNKLQKNSNKAVEELSIALKLNPIYEEAAIELGFVFIERKEQDAAIKVLTTFSQTSKNPKIYFYLGKAYYDKSDFSTAVKWFQKTIELDVESAETFALLGDALLRMNDFEGAKKILSDAAKNSKNPIVISKLGTVLFQIGQQLYIDEKKILNEIDSLKEGKKKLSKEDEAKATELQAEADKVKLNKENMLSASKTQFEEALKLNPSLKEAIYNMSMVHYLLKEYVEARDKVKKFIQLNPTGDMAKEAREQLEQLEEIIHYEEQKKLDSQK